MEFNARKFLIECSLNRGAAVKVPEEHLLEARAALRNEIVRLTLQVKYLTETQNQLKGSKP